MPKVTEGADRQRMLWMPPPPSGCACHLPLAGEDRGVSVLRIAHGALVPPPYLRRPDESQDPEQRTRSCLILDPDFRQDDEGGRGVA